MRQTSRRCAALTVIALALSMWVSPALAADPKGIVSNYDATSFARASARPTGLLADGRSQPMASPAATDADAIPVAAGLLVAQRRLEIERTIAAYGVEAVYFATIESGNSALVVTGTVKQTGAETWIYAAEPDDRLRIVFASGARLTYRFSRFDGDYSQPDGASFLNADHDVRFRFSMAGGTRLKVVLRRQGQAYRNSVKGRIADGGRHYELATRTEGAIASDIGSTGIDYESRERVTGTVAAEGFSATIDESHRSRIVAVDRTVMDVEATYDNRWQIGETRYALDGGRIFRTFVNGIASELDSWASAGSLTRDGAAIGGFAFVPRVTTIDTVLDAGGDKTVIYSDRAR